MIKFQDVTATYDNGSGIYHINFEVEKSELIFLMGPTGSGKSTVLKTIYRELEVNQGKILIDNDIRAGEKYFPLSLSIFADYLITSHSCLVPPKTLLLFLIGN